MVHARRRRSARHQRARVGKQVCPLGTPGAQAAQLQTPGVAGGEAVRRLRTGTAHLRHVGGNAHGACPSAYQHRQTASGAVLPQRGREV